MTVDSRTMERSELEGKVLAELQRIADTLGLEGHQRLRKGDLINAILEKAATDGQGARSGPTEGASAEGPEASAADASSTAMASR